MFSVFKARINHYLYLLSNSFLKDSWRYLKPCDVLLIRSDHDCGYTFQNKAYAQIIDSFGDVCTTHGLIVGSVATWGNLTGKRAYHSPINFGRQENIFIAIIKEGVRFGVRLIRGHKIDLRQTNSDQVNLWCQILEKSSPKCVIGIQPNEHLCQAGKQKKIPVYDLQHGAIFDANPWYGEVYRIETPIENLPDGFLCWDNQSASIISKWAENKGIRVNIIGNPWYLRFYRMQRDDLLVNEAVNKADIIADGRPCILVSLQWAMATHVLPGSAIPLFPDSDSNRVIDYALEKIILDTLELYNWVIRLHPVQMRSAERIKALNYFRTTFGAEKMGMWLLASEIPLPVLLNKTDLHITHLSSVVIEASWMGIRSGLINQHLLPGGKLQNAYYSYECSIGMADILPLKPDVIKQWIIDTLAKGRGQSMQKDTSQNLDAFINEIAKRKS